MRELEFLLELISDQKFHSHSQDRYGNNMTCANNCRGVNPNAVIIGGTAVLAAAAVTPLQVLTPLGLGALAAAGGGAAVVGQMMNGRSCPATRPCRVNTFPDDIATGETPPVITPYHSYGYSNFFNFYQLIISNS